MRGDRPRAAVEERGGRGQRPGALAAGHRVARRRTARRPGRPATAASGPVFTLPTSVTTASDAASAPGDLGAEVVRGYGDHDQLRVGPRACAGDRRRARRRCAGARTTRRSAARRSRPGGRPARSRCRAGRCRRPRPGPTARAQLIVGHRAHPGEVAAQRGGAVQVDVGDVGARQVGLDVRHHPHDPRHRALDLQLARADQRHVAEARAGARRTPGTPRPGRRSP